MAYTFDILGVTPVFTFFNYQQDVEQRPERSLAYVGSYDCTLDSLIKATELIPRRPDWDWDEVTQTLINFWLRNAESIEVWKQELNSLGKKDNLLVGRVANVERLRQAFESLL